MDRIVDFTSEFIPCSYEQRMLNLKRLKSIVEKNENKLLEAISLDLNRSNYETLLAEIYPFYKELNYFIKNLKKLMMPQKVKGNLASFGAKNYLEKHPYGIVAVISPWNYPFQLGLIPIVGAIAAGNKIILKPSEISKYTTAALCEILKPIQDFILVIDGGPETVKNILDSNIDYVFFTGSTNIGKLIMKSCAEKLIPHTLELGGKSPCIIENSADITVATKRIIWGKLLNAGQTCIAPDYILLKESIKEQFITALRKEAKIAVAKKSKFSKMISEKHYLRANKLLNDKNNKIVYKQDINQSQTIGLTILLANKYSDVMQEEIFAPILPIMIFNTKEEAVKMSKDICTNPLALYLFTKNKSDIAYYSKNILSGGMCVNDVILQVNNNNMPFGGVGQSGIGNYHGKYSFDTFSHTRATLINTNNLLFDMRDKINDNNISKLKSILTK